jgi:hypothetical protein
LHDGAAEQAFRAWHREERGNAHGAGRLAENRDFARIAAESRYIPLHPFERFDLVEKTQVGDAVAQVDEPFGAYPVTDGHAHDPIAGEPTTVIEGHRSSGVELEHAARDPDHHRQPRGP